MNKKSVRFLTIGAMLVAVAYMVTLIPGISIFPSAPFLTYDPKDIIVVLGGLIWGPYMSVLVSIIVSILEMITFSATGPIGCIMNILSTCAFACTASLIYKKKRTIKGAVLGLICGCLAMTGLMMLWNYLVTPLYMGVPREAIVTMLLPVFMPFNLLKGGINAALAFVLYKPIVGALRKSGLVAVNQDLQKRKAASVGYIIVAALILITCVLIILSIKNVI